MKQLVLMRLSGVSQDLYDRQPKGGRTKKVKRGLTDEELLEMLEENEANKEAGRLEKEEIEEIAKIIERAKKDLL